MALTIIPRSQWGANPVNTPAQSIAMPTPECWLHHTGTSGYHGASGMRGLQSNAIAGGYVDLEYTVVVDTDGTVYMSRGIGKDTAATKDHNSISHGVCAFGNYENETPTRPMLDALADCLVWLKDNGAIRTAAYTGPHRDASGNSTACCGRNLISQIDAINRAAASGGGGTPAPAPEGRGAMEICATPSGKGYYVAASDGGVYCYGDAKFNGSIPGLKPPPKLAAPIVGMAVTPSNNGYWLLGQDGGIFSFGDAKFYGAPTGKVPQ